MFSNGSRAQCYIFLLFTNVCNQLECSSLVKSFQPSLMFRGKAISRPTVEHLKDASLVQVLALLTKIELRRKGLPGTNTPAYYEHS
jgi:hypothetical protein